MNSEGETRAGAPSSSPSSLATSVAMGNNNRTKLIPQPDRERNAAPNSGRMHRRNSRFTRFFARLVGSKQIAASYQLDDQKATCPATHAVPLHDLFDLLLRKLLLNGTVQLWPTWTGPC